MRKALLLLLLFAVQAIAAADLRDLGVPIGYTVGGYEAAGLKLLKKDQYEAAQRYFTAAIRLEPQRWYAYYNRAKTFSKQKKWSAALQDLNACIHYEPAFFIATFARAEVYKRLADYNACLNDLDLVLRLTKEVGNYSEVAEALNDRAWFQSVCPDASFRNGRRAVADARKACELTKWKDPACLDTLAAAYAETGDFDSAVRYEEQAAVENASEKSKERDEWSRGCSARLQLYKLRRPCRGRGTDW